MQLEKDIEKKLKRVVERHNGLCLKWTCPGWSGVPDRIILLPKGRIIFCELKRPKGGKLETLQAWWHHRLRKLGFASLVVKDEKDIEEIERLIKE